AICQNQSATLTASSTDTAYAYTWNGGLGTGASVTVSPMSTTTYNVTAYNTTTGCGATQAYTVTVNILPTTPVITASTAVLCPGNATTLTATSIVNGPQTDPGSSAGNPAFSSTADEELFNVTFGTLNNSSTCSSVAPGPGSVNSSYNNYTTSVPAPNVARGTAVNGSVTIGYCAANTYSNICAVYIDYNRNGLFTDAGELAYQTAYGTSLLTGTAYPFTVNIPSTASLGVTRMRVVVYESSIVPTPTQTGSWGEGEDYLVNITGITSSYNWSTGQTGASVSVTPVAGANTYTVTATSSAGCVSPVGTYTITTNPAPAPVLSATDTTLCAPSSIDIYAVDNGAYASSGYPAGTLVEWLGYGASGQPQTTPINSSQGSTFQAKVTLPSGCYANSNVVTVTTRDIVVVPTITPAACGVSNGKVVAQIASAPAAPYNYVWTDGTNTVRNVTSSSTKDSISGLAPGTYYLSVYDNQGGALSCSATNLAYTVGGSTPPVLSATSSNITCNASGDGTVGVTILSGGAAPFTYSWSNGSSATSQLNVAAGTYTVTVSDVYGCSSTASVTVTEPAAITATETITQPCVNGTNGAVALSVAGGTGTTSVEWYDGSFTQFATGTSISGVGAGDYYALITDANACTYIGQYTVTETGGTFTTTASACDSYVWSQTGQTYSASGSYTSTVGCDNYVLNLTVTASSSNTTSVSACGSYTWSVDGNSYTQSGTYTSISGCHTEYLNLTILNVAVSGIAPSTGAIGSTVVISGADFTGATGVSFNGTAATSFTVNSNGQITATVPAGTTTGPVTVSVGQCSATSSGNFTVVSSSTLNLKAYIQGYYAGSGAMTSVLANEGISLNTDEVDTITVELYDAATGASLEASAQGVLMTDGTVSLSLPGSVVGNDYYIAVKHRNTVATWSASAVTFASTTSYDFTTAASQAYGDNMIEVETGVFAMYTGDINQDEYVDPYDYSVYGDDNNNFATGYYNTDLNGDGFVDPYDYSIYGDNNNNFIMSMHP
ncbi:MAG: beta strand repeat-containing protein, partial [Bacteroidota bacterium]